MKPTNKHNFHFQVMPAKRHAPDAPNKDKTKNPAAKASKREVGVKEVLEQKGQSAWYQLAGLERVAHLKTFGGQSLAQFPIGSDRTFMYNGVQITVSESGAGKIRLSRVVAKDEVVEFDEAKKQREEEISKCEKDIQALTAECHHLFLRMQHEHEIAEQLAIQQGTLAEKSGSRMLQ
jgi:hypothetical protein